MHNSVMNFDLLFELLPVSLSSVVPAISNEVHVQIVRVSWTAIKCSMFFKSIIWRFTEFRLVICEVAFVESFIR